MSSMLNCMDIYARPIMLSRNGQKYERSRAGGAATIVVACLAILASVQFLMFEGVSSSFDIMNAGRRRRLQGDGEFAQDPSVNIIAADNSSGANNSNNTGNGTDKLKLQEDGEDLTEKWKS